MSSRSVRSFACPLSLLALALAACTGTQDAASAASPDAQADAAPAEQARDIPVIADERYGEAIIDFFEARGISWTAWVFDPQWSPQLIQNWEFEPTRQGAFFRSRMEDLNPPE